MSNVGIWTLQYRIRHLRFEITVCEVNWQFGIELCRVLWIDLLEKGRLQLKVTGEEEECREKEPKTTEDMEDSSSQKRYEENRKQEGQSFRQEWKKTFAWLQFDETKQHWWISGQRACGPDFTRNT